MEYDEQFEKEKDLLLEQLAEGLREKDSAFMQEEYLDFIMSLSDGLIKSGLSSDEYFSRIQIDNFTSYLRK